MKRIVLLVVLLLAVILAIIVLSQKAARPTGGKQSAKLVVASRLWSPPHEKRFVIDHILKPFEVQNDCVIDFQTLDDDALLKRTRVQKDTGNVSTDVIIAYVSRMKEWVDRGYVLDLTEHVKTWQDRTFTRGFSGMTFFDGKQYFVPIGADNYLLCANRKALRYLPKKMSVAELTWEGLSDWAMAIHKGEGKGKFAFTGVSQKMLIYQVSAAILSYGGGFPDIASPEAMKAWKLFINMRDGFSPSVRTYDTVVAPMKREEAWLTVTHSARVGEIYGSNPTKFIIGPPPRGPAGMGSVAGVSGLAVVDGCPNKDLAIKFIKYVTRPDIQLKLARGTGGFIPTVNETAALLEDAHEDEVIRHAINVLEDGVLAYIPSYSDWGSVKLAFDEAFNKMVMEESTLDRKYLEAAQQKIDALRSPEPK